MSLPPHSSGESPPRRPAGRGRRPGAAGTRRCRSCRSAARFPRRRPRPDPRRRRRAPPPPRVARSGVAPMFTSAIAGSADAAVRALRDRRDPDRRPVLRAAAELRDSSSRIPVELRHADLGHHLLRPDRRLEDAVEEVRRGDRPRAVRPGDVDLAVEREQHRRQVRGRIAVRERAADRAAMAHLRIADQAGRVRDERAVLLHERRRRDVVVARQRADRELVARVADVRELLEPPDVDEQRRPRDPKPQQRAAASGRRRAASRPRARRAATTAWSTDSATS